jgi:uncharacterized protein YjbI with pentapeptide repeats
MANPEHVAILKQGVEVWNEWREDNPEIMPDLTEAILSNEDLKNVNLSHAKLRGSSLRGANVSCAILKQTNLRGVNFTDVNLTNSDMKGADLSGAIFIGTELKNADISGCRVYGISAWDLKTENLKQDNLIITKNDEPEITVDNLEIAQFVYLLLNNSKLRDVINTLSTKSVLILGRFTFERKAVLDSIREALRHKGYVPILFDFEKPATRNFSETVMTLASLSSFIIIDLSDPNSSPYEALLVSERLRSVPLQGIFCPTEGHDRYFAMYDDLRNLPHVLPVFQYETPEHLMASLGEKVIRPAEEKVKVARPTSSI